MNNDKSNITIGLPKAGGALFWAPEGTAIPVDAEAALSSDYINLGFVSEDGITFSVAEDGDDVKAWGPENVMRSQTGYTKTGTFNLLETSRIGVLQFVFGKDNVTVDGDGAVEWVETGAALPRGVFVCDTLQNNGEDQPRYKRQILGDAQFTDRSGDQTYNNSDPVNFPIVLTAYKFKDGDKQVYSKNYLSAPVAPTP